MTAVLFPADEVESLGYVLIYLINGSLPWEGIKAETPDQEEYKLIGEKKKSATVDQLCKGLPGEFCKYFQHIRSPGYDEPPDYAYLRRLFQNLFRRKGYEYDRVFDWTLLSIKIKADIDLAREGFYFGSHIGKAPNLDIQIAEIETGDVESTKQIFSPTKTLPLPQKMNRSTTNQGPPKNRESNRH